jgi:hypothetical protein
MMDGGDYSKELQVTPERLIAAVLVLLWIGLAYRIGGSGLAVRASILYGICLTFIWIPDLMARLVNQPCRKYGPALAPLQGMGLRIVAWVLIVGIPAWWAFMRRPPGD